MDENLINIETVKFPPTLSIDVAVALLNQTLTELQRNRYNILSTKHEGNNVFIIEYRKSQ